MSIREVILSLLDVSWVQSENELISHCKSRCEFPEREVTTEDVRIVIRELLRERWLIPEQRQGVTHYRRRSAGELARLQAANNPAQGSLL